MITLEDLEKRISLLEKKLARRYPKTNTHAQEITRLHDEGYTVAQIRTQLDLTYSTVYNHLYNAGITPNTATHIRPWTQKEHDLCLAMHKEGKTRKEIAKAINRSVGAVHQRLYSYS